MTNDDLKATIALRDKTIKKQATQLRRLVDTVESLTDKLRQTQQTRAEDAMYTQRFIDIIENQKTAIAKLRGELSGERELRAATEK